MNPSPDSIAWLTTANPSDVFAWLVGFMMLIIAAAQWAVSYQADRRALRIFALRYGLAGLAWWFTHPDRLQSGTDVPLVPELIALVLLAVTVWALDEFLGGPNLRRLQRIVAGSLAVGGAVVAYRVWRPSDPFALYLAMMLATSICAGMAWGAARREPGVGHLGVAGAFATYPVVMTGALFVFGWDARSNYSYLVAFPGLVVGVTILTISLSRAALRAKAEALRREAAEAKLADLNATLESQVRDRTVELQALVNSLEAFAGTLSHDLRGSLGGSAQLSRMAIDALARGDGASARQMLEAIAPQLEHMASLVQDLLTLTRLGETALKKQPQPLRQIADEALAQLAIDPDSANALQVAVVEVQDLPVLPVDGTLLRQVFVNLLANALRFAATNGAAARVSVGFRPPRTGEPPALFVSDNGPGFDPQSAAKLFQPFVRLHGGTLSRHGIGLSIVRRIVERHGGRVWAEGQPGRGAVFWFWLPGDPAVVLKESLATA